MPATLAAVLCLWVLKLVQQGYVDGMDPHPPSMSACLRFSPSAQQLLHCVAFQGTLAMLGLERPSSLFCALQILSTSSRGTSSCVAVAGLPVFTGPIYGWKGSQNGVLLGVLGIASIPISFLVGYISPHVSDRLLTLAAVVVTALGAILCTQAGLRKMAAAYFGGGGMLYLVS